MQNKRKRIKDKLKKTIALAVIANILLSLFCLSAFAVSNYPESLTLNQGDVLVLKEEINPYFSDGTTPVLIGLNFTCPDYPFTSTNTYIYIQTNTYSGIFSLEYETSTYQGRQVYATRGGNAGWLYDYYKTIEITETKTFTSERQIAWFYENVESGLPPLPSPGPLESAKDFYNTSLNFGTILISFITANAITIIPIILFVFIALLGCGIALIKRK